MITKLRVEGMSCQHCVRRVKTYLESLPDVSDVQVDLEGKEAVFHSDGNLDMQDILTAIGEFGFTAKEQA
jgi:copper chaperone CopZ